AAETLACAKGRNSIASAEHRQPESTDQRPDQPRMRREELAAGNDMGNPGGEERVDECRKEHAEHRCLHDEESPEAKLAPQRDGIAHVDEPGLQPALQP